MTEYSDSSMFWLTTRISNFAYLRYDMIGGEVRKTIDEWENARLAEVVTIDEAAKKTHDEMGHEAALAFMTRYSKNTARELFDKWSALDKYLLVKYMDGNVKRQRQRSENSRDARLPGLRRTLEAQCGGGRRRHVAGSFNYELKITNYD